jgi:putative transposase
MRPSKFSESQTVAGLPVAAGILKHGTSRATYFTWKQKYGSATVPELTRLRELEQENARPKRMRAELELENPPAKEVLSRRL